MPATAARRVLLTRTRLYMGDQRLTARVSDARVERIGSRTLARATGIDDKKLERLITRNPMAGAEPWLTEAARIAVVLGVRIRDLIEPDERGRVDWGFDTFDDVDVWRTGVALPLRVAGRLSERFGMEDPLNLYELIHLQSQAPLLREVWDQLMRSERVRSPDTVGFGSSRPTSPASPDVGRCAWCDAAVSAGAAHLPTCAPALLFGPRDAPVATIGIVPKPHDPRVRVKGGSLCGHGIRHLRERKAITQVKLASDLGIHPNYLSQLEKGSKPLVMKQAEKIAALFRVPVEEVYARPAI